MSTRMDRYNLGSNHGSRQQRNQKLYEEVKNSTVTNYEVKDNVSIISEDASKMSVSRVKKMLDEKYEDSSSRKINIEIPEFSDYKEEVSDTKEYDINIVLEKARQGKNVDYSKERLKKVRESQYDILNNLKLETRPSLENERKKEDTENLLDLINTITQIENKNKEEEKIKEKTDSSLDLLSDLKDDEEEKIEEVTEEVKEIEKSIKEEVKKPIVKEETTETEKIDYDDFKDISKSDKVSLIIKIITFVLIVGLVVGALVILNNILELNLF